jgi:hypothetical protein
MPTRSARLLCTGNDPILLETRCSVLIQSGYDAQAATLTEAETLLHREQFDLVVVSAWLTEWERGRILAAAGKTPAYALPELTLADELLAQVERRLIACERDNGSGGLATMDGDVLLKSKSCLL